MRATAILVCALSGLAACGGGPTPRPAGAPAIASPGPAAAVIAAPAPPERRTASAELRAAWPIDDGTHFALYADLAGLLHTELGQGLVPSLLRLATSSLTPDQARCVNDAAGAVRELALGEQDEGLLVIARVDDAAWSPAACVAALDGKPAEIDGAAEAFAIGRDVVVHRAGLLLAGRARVVKQALHSRAGARAFPAALSLGEDEYVAWFANLDESAHVSGNLLASSTRFRLGVRADLPEPFAAEIEGQLGKLQGSGPMPGAKGPEHEILGHLMQAVTLERRGGHLEGAFDLHEGVIDQARDLGTASTLAIYGVRRYLAQAKAAEARNSLGQIAKDYASLWEQDDVRLPRARRKLVSFPPVPREVPRGVKVQSSPDDWKPWAALRFSMDSPQYYQYEVRAAKDGESAEILARGDLDGDGKTSLFRVLIRVDRARGGELEIAPSIEETDPAE